MNDYIVLYRIESVMAPSDAPFGFPCMADNTDRAEEYCTNAHPDADVVWIVEGSNYQAALNDYWHVEGAA